MANTSFQDSLRQYVPRIGGLMHALRHVMREHGYIDRKFVPEIADLFNLSQAEVRGVISFYHDFRTQPPAQHEIRICQAEACQAQGSRRLTRDIEKHFKVKLGQKADDESVELQAVYCLGLCSIGPSMQIDGRLVAKATLDSVKAIDI